MAIIPAQCTKIYDLNIYHEWHTFIIVAKYNYIMVWSSLKGWCLSYHRMQHTDSQ